MKTIRSFVGLAFVLFASFFVVSCNDDSEETFEQQWASVLDNHGSNYDFSDGGKCFGAGGGISKENFDKMFIGHGWKHYGTWEIDKYGKRLPLEYYHNEIGASPDNYYFDSNTKLTIYHRSALAKNDMKKKEVTYSFNNNYNGMGHTVLLLDNKEYIQITGWTMGTQPSFCMVHPLGVKSNGETVYGVSIYLQMTDSELKIMQEAVK